jgi:hypothetical protein
MGMFISFVSWGYCILGMGKSMGQWSDFWVINWDGGAL